MGDSEGDAAGKLFIGGVSWQTTEAGLRDHFGKYGELIDAALMRNKHTGQPRGFGFVKFKEAASADKVCAATHVLDGRTVDVKRAVPREKTPVSASGGGHSASSTAAKLGNAGSSGELGATNSGGGCSTGASRGNLSGGSSSSAAGKSSAGKSSGSEKDVAQKDASPPTGLIGSSGSANGSSTSSSLVGSKDRRGLKADTPSSVKAGGAAVAEPTVAAAVVPEQARKIFVGGLAPTVTDSDFRAYFEEFGPITDAVVMFDRQTQRSRGFGFITFESEASLDGVFEVSDRHELNGKTVEVKRAEPKEQTAARAAAQQQALLLDPAAAAAAAAAAGGGGNLVLLPPGSVVLPPQAVHMVPPLPSPVQNAAAAQAATAHQRALDDAAGLTLAQRLARDLKIAKQSAGPAAPASSQEGQARHGAEGSSTAGSGGSSVGEPGGGGKKPETGLGAGWNHPDDDTASPNHGDTNAGQLYPSSNPMFGALPLQEHVPIPGMTVGSGHGVGYGVIHESGGYGYGNGAFVPGVDPSVSGAVYAMPFYSGSHHFAEGPAAAGSAEAPPPVAPTFAYTPMPALYYTNLGGPPLVPVASPGSADGSDNGGQWGTDGAYWLPDGTFDYNRAWYQGDFSMDASYNTTGYGGYRGQATTHGRLRRKFRPY